MTDATLATLAVLRKDFTEAHQKWLCAARNLNEDVLDGQFYLNLFKIDRLKQDADHKHELYSAAYKAVRSKMCPYDREKFDMHW